MEYTDREQALKKVKFYDRILLIGILSLVFVIASIFFLSVEQLEMKGFIEIWFIALFIFIGCEILFIITMAYNAYKRKQYGWMVVIIFLGTLFPLFFYFNILRKELKPELDEKQ